MEYLNQECVQRGNSGEQRPQGEPELPLCSFKTSLFFRSPDPTAQFDLCILLPLLPNWAGNILGSSGPAAPL